MKIIDSQIHIWCDSPEYPTPPAAKAHHGAEYTAEQALAKMDAHGIDRSVLVPIGGWMTGPTKNHYSMQAAQNYPDRFAVMGQFDYDAADREEQLAGWLDQPGMLGIRRYFRADATPITDGSLDWFWAGLAGNDIPFMSAAPNQMQVFHPVLARHPEMRLIIDHSGREPFDLKDDAVWADLDQTLALARYPNVSIKVSSLPSFSTQPYPFTVLHDPIRRIYDAFGPQRMLWGSDVTRLDWEFGDNIRLFTEALPFLSDEDKEWIMGKATAKALGWPL